MTPGSIVQCRSREWVLLPSDQENLLFLRPLTGATDEVVAVHKGLTDLLGYSFPEERVRSAKFPPPTPNDLSNVAGAHLLWQAARLTLREGATPLRSLGHVSICRRMQKGGASGRLLELLLEVRLHFLSKQLKNRNLRMEARVGIGRRSPCFLYFWQDCPRNSSEFYPIQLYRNRAVWYSFWYSFQPMVKQMVHRERQTVCSLRHVTCLGIISRRTSVRPT